MDINRDNWQLQFVLFDFAAHLTSHFGRSFSNHSYGYAFSNDRPNCFASHTANLESFMKYPGCRRKTDVFRAAVFNRAYKPSMVWLVYIGPWS
jgi:hypothetical protein